MSNVSNAKDNFYFLLSHLLFDKTLKIQESYHTEVLPRNHLHASSPKIQVFGSWMQMKWVTPLLSSWRSSCTFWEKKSHCENWYRNREGEREARQWGAQTMLGSFVWLCYSFQHVRLPVGYRTGWRSPATLTNSTEVLIYFFHPPRRTLCNGTQILRDNCKQTELTAFSYMSAKLYFSVSLCASINGVICSEHTENLLSLKSSWVFSKQITKNVMKCVFLTN